MNERQISKRLSLRWIVVAVIFVASSPAQDGAEIPMELEMPGRVEGTGTRFEVTDSEYLNIVLQSSEPVHLTLESVPQTVVMDIEAAEGASSTWITLSGFAPSTTYYKYEGDYHNGIAFTTNANGSYTYEQGLSEPRLIFIQSQPSTWFIPGDLSDPTYATWDPVAELYITTIGTWDPTARIYTLTTDVFETIQIDENNLTLDGDGKTIMGAGTGVGVNLSGRTDLTIQNLTVEQFTYGILGWSSSGNTLSENTASNNQYGICLRTWGNDNTLMDNTANWNSAYGIWFYNNSSGNTLTGNTASNNGYGIYFGWYSSNNVLTDNITSNNDVGILLAQSFYNHLGNNTTSNNSVGISLYYSSNNMLTRNTINWNDSYGIDIFYNSNSNTLTGNTASKNNTVVRILGHWTYWKIWYCYYNQIYNNNFVDNATRPYVQYGIGNVFNLSAQDGGGNYWSDWTSPDNNNDGFVDSPYTFTGGQDNLPWVVQDGWNQPPEASDDIAITDEDTPVTIDVLANDSDADEDALTIYAVTQGAIGSVVNNGDGTVTYTPNANLHGIDTFDYSISDGKGGTDTATVTVTVNPVNDPPVAGDDNATTDEDTAVTVDVLANDSDIDGDSLIVSSVTQGANGSVVDNGDGIVTYTPNLNFNGTDTFTYAVSDGNGGSDTATVTITVDPVNDPPVIGTIIGALDPVQVGTMVAVGAVFTDPDHGDTHTACWTWGDGTSSDGDVDELVQSVVGSHTYTAPGIYTVTLTITDAADASDEGIFQYVVVYDPSAGFVTGGGWINSPAGAYMPDVSLAGKANFGFVSKYKKGAAVPTGNTEFQFKAGYLNFHSSSYEWLVVTGSNYARFKGVGAVNGEGSYKFMLWAGDGEPDTFRIKIWQEDGEVETVIYDNGTDQAIGGGSVVVHTSEK